MNYKRSNEARSRNHSSMETKLSITYSKRVSAALPVQQAKRMRRIISSSVTCLALLHFFSTFSHKWHNFRGKKPF